MSAASGEVASLPRDPTGRFIVTLCATTFAVQLLGLHLRMAIFSGSWMTSIKYVTLAQRLGFMALLLVFSVAATGLWLLLWVGALGLVRVGRARALSIASTLWIMLLLLDYLVRQNLFRLMGNAFDFLNTEVGAGGVVMMVENVWVWYGGVVVRIVTWVLGIGASSALLWRQFRNPGRSWGVVDRITLRAAARTVAAATLTALVFLTACFRAAPQTHVLLTDHTLVGLPFGYAVVTLTDVDGDGWSPFRSPPDTAPFDRTRYPQAVDHPDDGIDQDLLAGDLVLARLDPTQKAALDGMLVYPPVTFRNRKNVLLVVLESVRFDCLAARVRGRPVMPTLQRLVAEGALAPPQFHASNGWTHSAVKQLFWGAYHVPSTTLVDDFKSNGYRVGAFSGMAFSREGFGWKLGLRKCDVIVDASQLERTPGLHTTRAVHLAEPVKAFLRDGSRPFFAYVFFDDPHFPYSQRNPPVLTDRPLPYDEIRVENRAELRRAYDNQVHHVDKAIGSLIETLQQAGRYEDTIVVVLSDHGESLFDDGWMLGHGTALSDVMTHGLMVVQHAPRDLATLLSHYHVRALLREWLTEPAVPRPRLVDRPGRKVMQFLGPIRWPSQIAELTVEDGQTLYDYENHTVTHARSGRVVPFDPRDDDPQQQRARRLIEEWEYLLYRTHDR